MAWDDDLTPGTATHNLASSSAKTIRAVAGPGSGKSFAIKKRIARLLESGMRPEEILAITFTRTAAQDLRKEISSLGIEGADLINAKTLHSHALKIIMRAECLESSGRTPRMVIDHELEPAYRDIVEATFGNVKRKKKMVGAYLAAWARLQHDIPSHRDAIEVNFETQIVNWLKAHNGCLVGEVIPIAIDFLKDNPASPEIGRYKVILIDEYQDLNKSEQELIRLLRGTADAVIVGDDDQSIYSFKFAHPEGIREVEMIHGPFEDIPFDQCRRCPQLVTRIASDLISANPNRTLGPLGVYPNNQDGIVNIVQWRRYEDEISGISEIIYNEINAGNIEPKDVLILAPRRRVGYKLRDRLTMMGVPVKSYFRESAIESDKVRRAYSLLNLLANPSDKISLRYLLGHGSNDYRNNQYFKLKDLAEAHNVEIYEILEKIVGGEIPRTGLSTIMTAYESIKSEIQQLTVQMLANPSNAILNFFVTNTDEVIDFTELNQLYTKAVEEEETDISSDFNQWIKNVFSKIQETISLPETPDDLDHARIMSLHSSKGLSAKLVILCSMIDQLMPYVPQDTLPEDREQIIQEQRRLFYVAITRCKATDGYPGRLIISSFTNISGVEALQMNLSASASGTLTVRATRFLRELGDNAPASVLGDTLLN